MKINEIAFTCYPVTDLKRARHFYEAVLGLKPSSVFGDDKTAWVEYDIGAGTLSIGNGAPEWKASAGGGCIGLEVENFDEAIRSLKEHKVSMKDPFDTPVCQMVVVADPDGNSLILHKRKKSCCGGENCSH
jgi:predicted enzyme related to lactoylglutathione lyase